jgi:tetratricopeptide (TPR) repeat protein
VELWFTDFSIAYACGFLGLRLVKTVSAQVLRHAELEEKLERVEVNEADMAYLKAAELLRDGQNEAAAELFRNAQTLEGENSIRSLIGLARAYRRLNKLGDAIATVDRAIAASAREKQTHRIPVAYWNRACYTALASKDLKKDADRILADLTESIKRQPPFRHDLMTEEDLKGLRSDDRFITLANG